MVLSKEEKANVTKTIETMFKAKPETLLNVRKRFVAEGQPELVGMVDHILAIRGIPVP